MFFDRSTEGRFNAPDASYGVLYAAEETNGALAETFLRTPGRTLIDTDLLKRKAYVRLLIGRDLNLIRLAGPGLARVGATAEVTHGGVALRRAAGVVDRAGPSPYCR
ncbi:RES domain-containing protein [Mesorhizobium sp. M00.F.Ca.ET.216.01.1.1]|uniref:RES domain-containing protein n=1 Tax=Mesorhizobium sp. M00.F.Ca.ET.216.01.1.1 TaxID=2500528 RepID=UPI002478F5B9|nr:RES domain-containing protein [Mesorhizobium sp. M00.F.Ca.ET.216.01.1.1]